MKSGIVQKIFLDHFDDYRRGRVLSADQRWAAWNIINCRTDVLGYHVDACPNGHYRIILKNSCKHRSCPQCGLTETELWLERRRLQALACKYFHIIFTISHELHPIWRWNRKVFTGLMLRGAWHSVRELMGDCRWLGAFPGAIGVFQSWDDEMLEHCHLHFIVSAGGLDKKGQWIEADADFLLPTPVLASKFRGKFLAYLRRGFNDRVLTPPSVMSRQKCFNLLNKLGRIRWHAQIEPAYEHADGVYKYVGRYLRRGPISEKRIVGYDGESVTIAYAHPEKHQQRTFRLDAQGFIERLLRHVPEKGTHLVRSYGLFHPNCRDKLDSARAQLGQPPYEPLTELPYAHELLLRMFPEWDDNFCPHCGALLETVYVSNRANAPPLRMAALK